MPANGASGMPPMQSLSNYTESTNMGVFADPGAGKTVLAGTSNGLILSFEPGTVSAARMGSTAKAMNITTRNQFMAIMRWMRRGNEIEGYGKISDFDWLCIDTVTEMQYLLFRGILEDGVKEERNGADIDVAQIQDYGKWQMIFKRCIKAINDLPINVLYLAHAMRTEDEEGNPMCLPDLNGKNGTNDATTMSRWFCGTLHAYGYLKVRTVDGVDSRRLLFKRSGPYFGKDRYGVLAPYVDNPDVLEMQKLILAPVGAQPAAKTRRPKAAEDTTEKDE